MEFVRSIDSLSKFCWKKIIPHCYTTEIEIFMRCERMEQSRLVVIEEQNFSYTNQNEYFLHFFSYTSEISRRKS